MFPSTAPTAHITVPKISDSVYTDAANIHKGMGETHVLEGSSNVMDSAAKKKIVPFSNWIVHDEWGLSQTKTEPALVRFMNSTTDLDAAHKMHDLGHDDTQAKQGGGACFGSGAKQETGSRGLNSVTETYAFIGAQNGQAAKAHLTQFGKFDHGTHHSKEFATISYPLTVDADLNVSMKIEGAANAPEVHKMLANSMFVALANRHALGDWMDRVGDIVEREVKSIAMSKEVEGVSAIAEYMTKMDVHFYNYSLYSARNLTFKTYDGKQVQGLNDILLNKYIPGTKTVNKEAKVESLASLYNRYFPPLKNVPIFSARGVNVAWNPNFCINGVHYTEYKKHIEAAVEDPVIDHLNNILASSRESLYKTVTIQNGPQDERKIAILIGPIHTSQFIPDCVGQLAFWRNRHTSNTKYSLLEALKGATSIYHPVQSIRDIKSSKDNGLKDIMLPLWAVLGMPRDTEMKAQYGATFFEILAALNHYAMTNGGRKSALEMIAGMRSCIYVQLGDLPMTKAKNVVADGDFHMQIKVLKAVLGLNLKHVLDSDNGLKASLAFCRQNPKDDLCRPRDGQATQGKQKYHASEDVVQILERIRKIAIEKCGPVHYAYLTSGVEMDKYWSMAKAELRIQRMEEDKARSEKERQQAARLKEKEEEERKKKEAEAHARAVEAAEKKAKEQAELRAQKQLEEAEKKKKKAEEAARKMEERMQKLQEKSESKVAEKAKRQERNKLKTELYARQIGVRVLGYLKHFGAMNESHPANAVAKQWLKSFRETGKPCIAIGNMNQSNARSNTLWNSIAHFEAVCIVLKGLRDARKNGQLQTGDPLNPIPGNHCRSLQETEHFLFSLFSCLRASIFTNRTPVAMSDDFKFLDDIGSFGLRGAGLPDHASAMVLYGFARTEEEAEVELEKAKPPPREASASNRKRPAVWTEWTPNQVRRNAGNSAPSRAGTSNMAYSDLTNSEEDDDVEDDVFGVEEVD